MSVIMTFDPFEMQSQFLILSEPSCFDTVNTNVVRTRTENETFYFGNLISSTAAEHRGVHGGVRDEELTKAVALLFPFVIRVCQRLKK